MPEEVDAAVGLPQEGPGKLVGVKEVTRGDGAVVERQEVVLADPSEPGAAQRVHGERGRGVADVEAPELARLLTEIKVVLEDIRAILAS